MPERTKHMDESATPARRAGRRVLLPALSAVCAFALLATMYLVGANAQPPVPGTGADASLDLNAPVTSKAQCMSCHADLGRSRSPSIVFAHGSHLLVACEACHWVPPHRRGGTIRPSMDSCFVCHGIRHGPGNEPLATAQCRACHPRTFKLRPSSHTRDWPRAPHAKAALGDSNRCLMCHDAVRFCDGCHTRLRLAVAPTSRRYRPIVIEPPRLPPVRVHPGGGVTMGQCTNCHADVDAFKPGRLIFEHAVHLERQYACESCHPIFPHGPDVTARPTMQTCYKCHDLVHAGRRVATGKCLACHPKTFKLKPGDHTPAFVRRDHRERANGEPAYCAMCHQPRFCQDCHMGRKRIAGVKPGTKVKPDDHKARDFRTKHGQNYLEQKGACGSCHTSAFCERCHKTPMPHPADWTSSHGLTPGLDPKDCNVCHVDRRSCQECHHKDLRGQLLIRENCVRCHPEAKVRNATTLKNKGLAEHFVHFDVAKRVGSPYKCEECHVGFAIAEHSDTRSSLTGGHDLRVCYTCHGALDTYNVEIAPYPGQSLCLRCHKDLRL